MVRWMVTVPLFSSTLFLIHINRTWAYTSLRANLRANLRACLRVRTLSNNPQMLPVYEMFEANPKGRRPRFPLFARANIIKNFRTFAIFCRKMAKLNVKLKN